MLIREEQLTQKDVRNLLEEFEDLLIFLHREKESIDWERVTEKFTQPIAVSLPTWCKIKYLVKELVCDEQPVNQVVLKFSLKSDCDE